MKSEARVVVIGGGVVGCSVLYHLTKGGWKDVVLVERDQLTSGSTWHAAGGFHTLNGDPNVAKLQGYTIGLYDELERISGQSCGLHRTGGLLLADTPERMEWLKMAHGRARYLGLETELLTPKEAKKLLPLIEERYFVGAMLDAADGNLDPSGTTHAYAKSARIGGAEIYLQTRVTALERRAGGTWKVITDKGTIHAEHVVNCGGLWAREIGRMVGLELPVLAMEHMYLVTDEMPEVVEFNRAHGHELTHAIDFKAEIYMRQERSGILLGTYEKACVPWQPRQTPWDFGNELLPPDLERIAPSLELGYRHFPAMERAGIKRVVNGPFTFSPDGNPLVGPVQGLPGYWCACAVMAGFSQGGGVGLALSQWMVNGDPGFDVWAMDVARYGEWATRGYTNAKVRENYARRFSIRFPNEELPAARPQQTTALYDLMLAQGAVMGDSWGLEAPLWFAPRGVEPRDVVSFHRSNDFAHVKAECHGVRNAVGVTEIANFAKYELEGAGAEGYLSRLMTNRMPREGRLVLTPMLNEGGKLIGDFTIAIAAAGRDFGLVQFGMRALLSLRLEKNFPTWYRELRPIYGPFEAALERFVDLSKSDFIGREAALREKESGGKLRRVTFVVDATDAGVVGDEPIWHDGKVIGWVTSGGYGHYVERSLAQGYVPRSLAVDTGPGAFEIEILGERRAATMAPEPLFDPQGRRMRG